MLMDQSCVEQFLLFGRAARLRAQTTFWKDREGQIWARRSMNNHQLAVCATGPSWIFDECARNARQEQYANLVARAEQKDDGQLFQEAKQKFDQLRFGSVLSRVCWTIHRTALELKRSAFLIPDFQLSQNIWGAHRPTHWRGSIRRALETLSVLHMGIHNEPENQGEMGTDTALLIHAADLRGSPNDKCESDCPAISAGTHSHFIVNIGQGFLGCLEQCCNEVDSNGVRSYTFPSRGERRTGASLQQLGKTGRLVSAYFPALIGNPAQCKELSANQHRLLQAIVRETTRQRRKNRNEFSEPEIVEGNHVPDVSNRRKVVCPLLEPTHYVAFNGNGVRKGCGYLLSSESGWLAKSGYDRSDVNSFLSDLNDLARKLNLRVVGVVRRTDPLDWRSLGQMMNLSCQNHRNSLLRRIHLRIYADPTFLEQWNHFFQWPPQVIETQESTNANTLNSLVSSLNLSRTEIANRVGVDPSLFCKYLNGRRPCPTEVVVNVETIVRS